MLKFKSKIFEEITGYEVIESGEHDLRALINGKYGITLKDDMVFLDLHEAKKEDIARKKKLILLADKDDLDVMSGIMVDADTNVNNPS